MSTPANDHDKRKKIDHFAEAEKWLKIAEDRLAGQIQRFSAVDQPTDDDGDR